MTRTELLSRPCRLWLVFGLLLVSGTLALGTARGQDLELNAGWSHVTGDNGTNGLEVGAAWWFTDRVTVAANYDSLWGNSLLSNFAFTSIGAISTHSRLQSWLIGPRIFFSSKEVLEHKINPFAEAQFGASHLSQTVSIVNTPSLSASSTSFTWLLGGGAEYLITPHWSGRANLDFERTHFASSGQSRLRLVLGITYTFGSRE